MVDRIFTVFLKNNVSWWLSLWRMRTQARLAVLGSFHLKCNDKLLLISRRRNTKRVHPDEDTIFCNIANNPLFSIIVIWEYVTQLGKCLICVEYEWYMHDRYTTIGTVFQNVRMFTQVRVPSSRPFAWILIHAEHVHDDFIQNAISRRDQSWWLHLNGSISV